MKRLFFALFVLACLVSPVRAQPVTPEQASRIDSLFARFEGRPGAAVAVLRGDTVVFSAGYGLADLENQVPITPETVFLIASVSKQFTAFAMAMLEGDGLLDLEADVRSWFPELRDYGHPITVRHLIHHTSGIRDSFDLLEMAGFRMDDVIRQEDILGLAWAQEALNFTPGAEYSYSNTGYAMQAALLTRITGRPFAAWMQDQVFGPLGMHSSRFLDDRRAVVPARANGYAPDGDGGFRRQLYAYESVGETGLFTTVLDLAKWVVNFNSGAVGGRDVLRRTHDRGVLNSGDTLSYAFGQSLGTYRGRSRISHGGWHRGFRTHLARYPDDSLAVIVLGNSNDFESADMGAAVADVFFVPGADSLKRYAGTYVNQGMGTSFALSVNEKGVLTGQHPRGGTFAMKWEGPDEFSTTADAFEVIRFQREGGEITGFLGSTSRSRNVPFVRTHN